MALALLAKKGPMTLLQMTVRHGSTVGPKSMMMHQPGYWNDVWRPGPVPTTEEERIACARKYGLIPADYEHYPDDGTGYGDYPKLDIVAAEARDPYELFDMPELKRNFCEPLHVDFDMLTEDKVHYNHRPYRPFREIAFHFFRIIGTFGLLLWIFNHWRFSLNMRMPRHDPFNKDQKHLSFDLVPID